MSKGQLRFILQDDGLITDLDGQPIELGGYTLHIKYFKPRLRTGLAEVEFSDVIPDDADAGPLLIGVHSFRFDSGEVRDGPTGTRSLP